MPLQNGLLPADRAVSMGMARGAGTVWGGRHMSARSRDLAESSGQVAQLAGSVMRRGVYSDLRAEGSKFNWRHDPRLISCFPFANWLGGLG
jgi:hypothetical protein